MAVSSCPVSGSMKSWKWPLSPYKGKWQQTFSEQQAMETLKKKVSEENKSPTNFLSILTDSFRSYDSDPSPSAYSFIIKYLFRRHLLAHVPLILDHLEKVEKFDVPERIFVNLIRDYGRVGMLQDAIDTFFRIPKFRCTPSVISLNSLLAILCKKKEGLLFVREVLMKTPEMNIRLEASTFWILIRALCRNGKILSAVELLNMMPLHECTPDGKFYSLVLCSFCKQSGSSEIMGFLEEMRNVGFLPTAKEYKNVIDVLVGEGKVDDAYHVLGQMKYEGRRPDIVSYNSILDGFIVANNFQMADELFDEILLMGLVPDSFTYNTYTKGLCKQGKLEQACKMVICMERAGCKPDLETFNTLMAGHIKAGEMGKARDIMSEILKRGHQWDSHTYTNLIEGLLDEGGMAEAGNRDDVQGIFSRSFNF